MTETVDTTTGEIVQRSVPEVLERGALPAAQVELVTHFLTAALPEGETDPAGAAVAIMAQVLSATSPEEVLADLEAAGLREHTDEPFTLESAEFRRSEFEEGMPFYTLLRGVDVETGAAVVYTTGSQKITAQVFKLLENGWLPRTVVAKQAAKPTKRGHFPLRLADAPK